MAKLNAWTGLAYKLGQFTVVSAMQEVSAMLTYPDIITPVPNTRTWFLGLTHTQGRLLPVIDLAVYLQFDPTPVDKTARILVMRMHDLYTGLLVPSVFGIRHFDPATQRQTSPEPKPGQQNIAHYLQGVLTTEEAEWPVFSLDKLAQDNRFRDAVIRTEG